MFFFNKPFNPQRIQPPEAIRTLPFDLLRTQLYPREAGIRAAAIQAGPQHVAAWLPQRMLFANHRHQPHAVQQSPQPLSPVMATRPSGTFLRTMSMRSHPLTLQPAYRAAQQIAAQQMAQVRPSAWSQKAATEAQILDRLGRTVPRIGERIDPRELTAAIDQQVASKQWSAQQSSEKTHAAIQQAFATRLNTVKGLGR